MATAATTSSCLQCRVGGTRWLLGSRLQVHQQFLTPPQLTQHSLPLAASWLSCR